MCIRDRYLADTKVIAAAKNFHLGAISQASARGGHGGGEDGGSGKYH